jgi:DNA polymerase III alpha subunit (gram-positive type)
MKKILFLDLETTGIDPKTCYILEYAGILTNENLETIKSSSFLINQNMELSETVKEITGIHETLSQDGYENDVGISKIQKKIDEADILVAHNGFGFDFKVLETNGINLTGKHLIDTYIHYEPSKYVKSKELFYLVAKLGLMPVASHRALPDCIDLLRLCEKAGFNSIYEKSKYKLMLIQANASRETKDRISGFGFRWTGKNWIKVIPENLFDNLQKILREKDVSLSILISELDWREI